MKPMLATAAATVPKGDQWSYEVKYDGFRCLLHWDEDGPALFSRNEKELSKAFPEIIQACLQIEEKIKKHLPLIIDAELVSLANPYQSTFSIVHRRAKLRSSTQITNYSKRLPVSLMVFDLLMEKGRSLTDLPLKERRRKLNLLENRTPTLAIIQTYKNPKEIETIVKKYNGEGIVAKKNTSTYISKRSSQWIKIKNYRYVHVILTEYDKQNSYFQGAVYQQDTLVPIVQFSHGLHADNRKALASLFEKNGERVGQERWSLPPSICVEVGCISFDGDQLREPFFHSFLLEERVEDCTWQNLLSQLQPLPANVVVTSDDKPIWPAIQYTKMDYLQYLHEVASTMLPFLTNRLLTTIRYPHGAESEAFYQKNCPDYAPEFIHTHNRDGINYIVCHSLESLLWLGNQLALEYHLPFQNKDQSCPSEIVFDLDPPSVEQFSLAVKAALALKEVITSFGLMVYIKTSGNKGLQLYLPLPEETFTYQETRVFCQFISRYVVEQHPEHFTLERLKKNRANRLYVDYLQHDEGKTLIAPYSPRGHSGGLVATPLYWEEVTNQLSPSLFTLTHVVNRLKLEGDPFRTFRENVQEQGKRFSDVLLHLQSLLS